MHLKKNDLIIRLDADNGVLQLLTVKNSDHLELQIFHEIQSELIERDQSIEIDLGVALLSFLSSVYDVEIFGLEKYRDAARCFRDSDYDIFAEPEDAEGKFRMAVHLIAKGLRGKSSKDIDRVEGLLRDSANAGSENSIAFVEKTLPFIRKRFSEFHG